MGRQFNSEFKREWVRPAEGEWRQHGVESTVLPNTVDVEGWPLDVGISVQDGFLRAQAEACGHGQVDPHELLHDHRKRAFAKFTHADGGAVWVEAAVVTAGSHNMGTLA